MAYLNINNMCVFEGRLTTDPELSRMPANGGQQGLAKVKFKIAIDRTMNKQQKEEAQKNGKPTADFVPVEMIGQRAEFVANYFKKGSGIKAVCSYKTFSYQKDGQTHYGQSFEAVDVGFSVQNSGNGNGGNNGGNNNNSGGNQGFEPSGLDPQGFQTIDDDDLPF